MVLGAITARPQLRWSLQTDGIRRPCTAGLGSNTCPPQRRICATWRPDPVFSVPSQSVRVPDPSRRRQNASVPEDHATNLHLLYPATRAGLPIPSRTIHPACLARETRCVANVGGNLLAARKIDSHPGPADSVHRADNWGEHLTDHSAVEILTCGEPMSTLAALVFMRYSHCTALSCFRLRSGGAPNRAMDVTRAHSRPVGPPRPRRGPTRQRYRLRSTVRQFRGHRQWPRGRRSPPADGGGFLV